MNDFSCQQVVEICKDLHRQGFLAAADGNVSFRQNDKVFITPSGVAKTSIQANELAELDLDGSVMQGRPSSERLLHLMVYNQCPDAKAVVHAHPPCAIAFTIANPDLDSLPEGAMSELILAVGRVPIAPYARPGTEDLAANIRPYIQQHRAMILARHGVLCWGETLREAQNGVERIEHAAKVLGLAMQMGGISLLADDEIDALKAMRRQLGNKTL